MVISRQGISGLSQIVESYDAILCDVWGVLHNGVQVWPHAAQALENARRSGVAVIMITNAPRPQAPVLRQLEMLGCPEGVFDDLVTSGDVTRELIAQIKGGIYHIGPERDFALYDGLQVEFSDPENASGIVCTGLFDDRTEHPREYVDRFRNYVSSGLPFICANPDIVVEVGDRLLWCAGALAREYEKLGGETRIVGKPHPPIYELAIKHAESALGKPLQKKDVLAIGDGMPTDIAGAQNYGLDALFISGGIHEVEYASGVTRDAAIAEFLDANNASPVGWMTELRW